MTADNDTHDFEVENEEPDDLPGKELTPEPGGAGWSGREGNLFRAWGDVFFLHMLNIWL